MLDRLPYRAAPGAPRHPWLNPHRLEYMPLNGQLAAVRLVASLHGNFGTPARAVMVVGGPNSIMRAEALGSLAHRVPRRFRAADELLWRVTFALPLELVQYPEAVFGLLASGFAPARLPDAVLASLDALSQPWPVGPRGALLLTGGAWRRAVALGTVIAVTSTSSAAPALALVAHGSSHTDPGQAQQAASVKLVHASGGTLSPATRPTAAHPSGASAQSSRKPAALVRHDTTSSEHHRPAKRAAAHATSGRSASAHAGAARRAAGTHPVLPSPARVAGTSGTDPGSSNTSRPSAAVLLAGSRHHGQGNGTQPEILGQGGDISRLSPIPPGKPSKLSPIPPGLLGASPRRALRRAVGHAGQGGHHANASTPASHGHATVPVQGAHPVGTGGGAVAAPKPPPPPPPPVSTTPFSGSTPGSSPFTTGANAPGASVWTRLAGIYSQVKHPPPFLIPIYKRAGARFHVPWSVLAAINSVETDYGRDLNTSSAGAIGWMQFMPSTWAQYGMAIDHSGPPNPYNPADAIFAAARYLAANGASKHLSQAIYAYNHAHWYVDEVLLRAQLIRAHAQGGLVNPFPLGWAPNRLDLGYDGTFRGAILAPFSGTITYAARSFSNWGGWVELRADKPIPGLPSDTLYFAEGLAPVVKTGVHVGAGQLIAVPAPSPYGDAYNTTAAGAGQIEWGVASPGPVGSPTNPLAESHGNPTALVVAFAKWAVESLGIAPPSQTSHAGYA